MKISERYAKYVEDLNMKKLTIILLEGYQDYKEILEKQKELLEKRIKNEITDTLILLEHNHVYTLGLNTKEKTSKITREELEKKALVYPIERGGKMTYHGPGQIVGYLIAKIKKEDLAKFVDNLENVTIKTLRNLGINAYSRKSEKDSYNQNIRGAWFKHNNKKLKLAAQGIETKVLSNYIYTMHGFAINIGTDLSFFEHIYPCGFEEQVMGSAEMVLNKKIDLNEVKSYIEKNVKDIFNYNILLKTA